MKIFQSEYLISINQQFEKNLHHYHYTKGKLFQRKKSHEDAAECFEKALEIRPNDHRILPQLG